MGRAHPREGALLKVSDQLKSVVKKFWGLGKMVSCANIGWTDFNDDVFFCARSCLFGGRDDRTCVKILLVALTFLSRLIPQRVKALING